MLCRSSDQWPVRGLRGIDVLAGDKHVRIAAGERWYSVFAALEAHKPPLTTAGGRSRNVGAVGFLLGAGLSSLSAGFGFSADMVTSWEVRRSLSLTSNTIRLEDPFFHFESPLEGHSLEWVNSKIVPSANVYICRLFWLPAR